MRRLSVVLLVVTAAVAVSTLALQRAGSAGAVVLPAGPPLDDSTISLRVRFGVTDAEPRAWDGTVTAENGSIVALRNWHPRPEEQVSAGGWKLATRRGMNFQRRAWEEELPTAPVPYMLVPGIIADVKAAPGARLRFSTRNGDFTVEPVAVRAGAPAAFLNGAVLVDRVPYAQALGGNDHQNDFPAIIGGSGGEVWLAWTAYRDKANEVFARRFDGNRWGPAVRVTDAPSDVYIVKLGRDGRGRLWVVWAAQVSGNWDLYARRFDGSAWSAVERLTDDAQPDLFPATATDSNGQLWVVWQGFRAGKSDIFARRYDAAANRWSAAERVSNSPANDWEPAVATDSTGRAYVAWDTYDKGNYDVTVRAYERGEWQAPVALASTEKFEAHVTLACDRANRLWAAWNESGTQWGKDAGFLVKREATRLYQWRSLGVAVLDGGNWQEPAADVNETLPADLREYNDFPALQSDAAGRVWLFFRHRTARFRDVHSNAPLHRAAWEIFGTTFEGGRWTVPVMIPFSQGRQDVRGGLALDGRGNLYAAWATDNRDFDEFLFKRSDVYAARVPLPAAAQNASPLLRARVQPKLSVFPGHLNEPKDLDRIRGYVIESGGNKYRIYRGDTHRHTEFSMDGNNDGSLLQTYRYAMDAAELDFLGVSEHNGASGPDLDYVNFLLQQMADVLTVTGRFSPLYGYERSLGYPNGHRNVMFATRGVPTLPIPPEEQKAVIGAKPLYEYLKKYRGIAISHTSATSMGTDWRDNDPEVEPLVEIYQGDRVSAEYEGAPKAAHRGNPSSAPGGFRPLGYVWNAWAKGYKLGVQASSDHLSTHISYACTLATDFSREGLLDAMRKRHSYGATDNIILDYRLQAGGKEYLQGEIVRVPADFRLSVKVIGTAQIRQIDIIRNNQFIHTRHPLRDEETFTFADAQPPAGESYYYVRVIQVDDNIAWSSPIWVQR